MRKLVLQTYITLDGTVSSPRSLSAPDDPDSNEWLAEAMRGVGTHIMGRVTYLDMAAYWPTSPMEVFADLMNDAPKVVFSKSLEKAEWPQSRIARGDLVEEINKLKNEPGGDIIAYGGAAFVQDLCRKGVIDEYRLMVRPGAVGVGEPLFKDLPEVINLELVDAKPFTSIVAMTYRPRA
jgi:dihydrofolate reductase